MPGAGCMPAVAGAGWGCFPLCLLGPGDGQRCRSRPVSFGQPIVVQLRGEGEGQLPLGFPTLERATMPALPSLKQKQVYPTQTQGWVVPAGTQGCLP